ncbi:hypothetical protein [Allocoleopsis franciscana]|uniref:hypothetical protein n=1 Tax=Allocoleopsis franciscana TaxID=2886352 RepID=UPI0002FD35E6|nr:hypothetical protein [Allocoleopsis franciscana]
MNDFNKSVGEGKSISTFPWMQEQSRRLNRLLELALFSTQSAVAKLKERSLNE